MEGILLKSKEMCCGCGSCALVCPTKAIVMVPQELGCLYPKIDSNRCIKCGACERVCAYSNRKVQQDCGNQAYAAAAREKELLKSSASGGIFAAIAHRAIEAGGIVYGCSMETVDGNLTPAHIGIGSLKDVAKLQGSKYVQSILGDTFAQIRNTLRQGRTVLFSGTPCQVDALKHYVKGTDSEKLYTVDIICHGVPSVELFQGYIKTLENQHRGRITSFCFRDKTRGWGLNASYIYQDRNGTQKEKQLSPGLSSYYSFFLESEIYRQSCYSCRYANMDRVGDITIGDFWGIEQEHPECLREHGGNLSVEEGVSVVLSNNPRGEELLALFGGDLEMVKSEAYRVAKWNRQLCGPSRHSDFRNKVVAAYGESRYAGIEKLFRRRLGIRYYVRTLRNKLYTLRKD